MAFGLPAAKDSSTSAEGQPSFYEGDTWSNRWEQQQQRDMAPSWVF